MRFAGFAAFLQGLAMVIACTLFDGLAFVRLGDAASAQPMRWVAVAFGAVGIVLGLLLFIGGFLLMTSRYVGRALPLVYGWAVIPLMLGGMIASAMVATSQNNGNALFASIFWFHSAMATGSILFGIVIAWILLTGNSARWIDSRRGSLPAPLPAGASPLLCVPALLSLIFAFLPPPILMQIASLILGLCALGMIRRSNGNHWGRGMAITGTLVSLTLLLLVGTISAGAAVGIVLTDSAKQNEKTISARLDELGLAQHVYQQMSLASDGSGGDCTSSLTDLLNATSAVSPVEDSPELVAADRATLGASATPYHGYYFKLTTWADARADDPAPHWVIFAWPARWLGSTHAVLMLQPGNPPMRLIGLEGEPPTNPTHDQIDPLQSERVEPAKFE
jgi:hypothetical protein